MKFRHWAGIAAGAIAVAGASTLASANDEIHGQPSTQGTSTDDSTGGYGTEAGAAKGKASALTEDERLFLDEMAQGNLAEVQIAKLGQQKATSPEVKQFAGRLVKDHQKTVDDLKALGTKVGYTVPNMVDEDGRRLERNLTNLTGAEFDRRFMSEMTNKHSNMIDDLEDMEKDAKNADIKAWIGKTLPQLKAHLTQAQQLEDKVSAAGYGETQGSDVQGGSETPHEGDLPQKHEGDIQQDPAMPESGSEDVLPQDDVE